MDMSPLMRKFVILFPILTIFIGLCNGVEAQQVSDGRAEGDGISTRHKRSSAKDRWRGPTYRSEYWGTDRATTTLGGLASYRQREMYKEDPDDEPTVCFNSIRPRNGYFAYFICPEYGQSDSYVYCCGDDGEENCCTFWGDGGRVAGVVIAILVFVALVVVGIVLLVKFVLWPRYVDHEVKVEKRHHNPTLDNTTTVTKRRDNAVPLTSVDNDYGDYPDLRRDRDMQPVHRGHPSESYGYHDRGSYNKDPFGYDSEPRRISSEPRAYRSRSYDSEPRGYNPTSSEQSSRHSGSRRSDKDREYDIDPKKSFKSRSSNTPSDDSYEPVSPRRGHGSRYSDFDTLGSPVAKHPPGLPPHDTAV